ncbi:50S ribosomal protein L11 [Candidatus Nardonella dryophthoridicola]|uniref:Large ribosomal subunit protein uL11 n=1 Tax=endosymbiont of Rhynchophorus ferrugineus TaxID=1972133 RepID=A0A2Z5T3V4_9GAMM|nr:50S ribosomal protein L11 [Candidatus Nardonella dryophthoridicola]QTJ62837.1 50S ribosomal protein L11 [Candidatus Nardonella dryophthoridicola]BBA85081.1 50S ribosomal protein L11 [endosymbiont of Rhynchophorus ferrugineus]
MKIKHIVKIQIPSQNANPSPPIGPILGQKGINIIKFCNDFNNETKNKNIEKGIIIPVVITIFEDKNFVFLLKNPPVSFLLKRELKIECGSKNPGKLVSGVLNIDQIRKIALLKINEFNTEDVNSIIKSIIGTAKSMGIIIKK